MSHRSNAHNNSEPRTHNRKLASDPAFFCEVIRIAFRSRHETNTESRTETTAEQKSVARNAYTMLHEWRIVPGTEINGQITIATLMDWIEKVKDATKTSGHFEVAMQMLGEVFVHSPADPDGLWMHRGIAEALNRPDMQELREGYRTGIYNSRGVHWVDPTGAPEKQLAEDYAKRADQIENAGFHRLAATLREISATYQREAETVVREARAEETENKD